MYGDDMTEDEGYFILLLAIIAAVAFGTLALNAYLWGV